MREIFDFYDERADELFTPKRCGYIGVVLYVVVLLLVMFFFSVSSERRVDEMEKAGSIVISFGEDMHGGGDMERVTMTPSQVTAPAPTPESSDVITDPDSDVEVDAVEEPTPETQESSDATSEEIVEAEVVRREVNRQALFPGSATASSESKGVEQEDGFQGAANGAMERSAILSEGLTGDFSLAGRNLVGSLPSPRYGADAEGRVVISISVDEDGRVTTASLRSNGSTTNNSVLIEAARDAAMKARFTPSNEFVQNGTITYIFKMR